MTERCRTYNETLRYVEQEEKNGTVLVIQPQEPLTVGRMERNPQKLEKLYLQGYEDARKSIERINQF